MWADTCPVGAAAGAVARQAGRQEKAWQVALRPLAGWAGQPMVGYSGLGGRKKHRSIKKSIGCSQYLGAFAFFPAVFPAAGLRVARGSRSVLLRHRNGRVTARDECMIGCR